jgi:glutaredoxin 3
MFCGKVKEFLSLNQIDFVERDVTVDETALADLQTLRYMTTPVTVADDEVIVGFDRDKLEKVLKTRS